MIAGLWLTIDYKHNPGVSFFDSITQNTPKAVEHEFDSFDV